MNTFWIIEEKDKIPNSKYTNKGHSIRMSRVYIWGRRIPPIQEAQSIVRNKLVKKNTVRLLRTLHFQAEEI